MCDLVVVVAKPIAKTAYVSPGLPRRHVLGELSQLDGGLANSRETALCCINSFLVR